MISTMPKILWQDRLTSFTITLSIMLNKENVSHRLIFFFVFLFISRVATKSNSAHNMMNGVWAAQSFPHNILRMKCLI